MEGWKGGRPSTLSLLIFLFKKINLCILLIFIFFSKKSRVEGWKGGRVEGWKGGTPSTLPLLIFFQNKLIYEFYFIFLFFLKKSQGWKGGRVEGWQGGRVEGKAYLMQKRTPRPPGAICAFAMKLSTLHGLGKRMCVLTGQQLTGGVRESAFRSKRARTTIQCKVAHLGEAFCIVVLP